MIKVLEMFGEPIISGGQESFVNNVLMNIDMSQLKIDYFTPYYCDNDIYKKNIELRGGCVYEAKLPFNPGGSRKNITIPLDKLLKKNCYDVIHIHSGSVSVLKYASKIAKKNKVQKIIVHSHSPAEHETVKHILSKLLAYHALNNYPTNYLACSIGAAKWKFPKKIANNETKIIKNGINLSAFKTNDLVRSQLRKQLGIKQNEFVIGHVGRFSREKNQNYLIDLLKELSLQKREYKLLLVGNGELLEESKQYAIENNLANKILFLGNISNVNEIMQVMDIFVLPSLYEGLPLVGVEAQAVGLRMIASTNVSEELKLTNLISFCSLNNTQEWIDVIENTAIGYRQNTLEQLKEVGFDILDTVSKIKELYIE